MPDTATQPKSQMQSSSEGAVERLERRLHAASMTRDAWQDCHRRLQETLRLAHEGRPSRAGLSLLADAARKAELAVQKASAEEALASAGLAYLKAKAWAGPSVYAPTSPSETTA
jgi:hypothetical protein